MLWVNAIFTIVLSVLLFYESEKHLSYKRRLYFESRRLDKATSELLQAREEIERLRMAMNK